jgi:hypothetical protein
MAGLRQETGAGNGRQSVEPLRGQSRKLNPELLQGFTRESPRTERAGQVQRSPVELIPPQAGNQPRSQAWKQHPNQVPRLPANQRRAEPRKQARRFLRW